MHFYGAVKITELYNLKCETFLLLVGVVLSLFRCFFAFHVLFNLKRKKEEKESSADCPYRKVLGCLDRYTLS